MKNKILVLSLLRLGDIVLSTPILRGLREKEPESEIHILINSQFAQIADLIPFVDRVLLFDREEIQRGLGQVDRSLFEPYERMKNLIRMIESENYDVAINLTQNRLSGYLMRLIRGPMKVGLSLETNGQAQFGSPWFRYLNDQAENDGDGVFHYTDVFRFALGIDRLARTPDLIETDSGRNECEMILGDDKRRFVLVQPFTSDVKKDWGTNRFSEMIALLSRSQPSLQILVLAAPSEAERLQPMMRDLERQQVPARLAVCSLAGAFSLLRQAEALITGDTSIKHLACAARTPLIEICIGSSDYNRTGAYLQNSIIIRSKEACAPCVHSRPCHRERQFCAERISPEAVAMVAAEVLTGDLHQLRIIAAEYRDELDILRVELEESGFWVAWSVLEPFTETAIGHWLSLSGQKIHLEEERLKDEGGWGEVGSETIRLERLLRKIHPDISASDWRALFAIMERQAMGMESRLHGFQIGLKSLYGSFENPERLRTFVRGLISFREKLKTQPFLKASKLSLDELIEDDITPPFVRFRRIVDALTEIRARTAIELKLIRTLMDRMEAEA